MKGQVGSSGGKGNRGEEGVRKGEDVTGEVKGRGEEEKWNEFMGP